MGKWQTYFVESLGISWTFFGLLSWGNYAIGIIKVDDGDKR